MLRVLSLLIVIFACGFGERQLLCSSRNSEAWYTCSGGGLYYSSLTMEPCLHSQIKEFTLNYTIILMVKLDHASVKINIWHHNQKMIELVQKSQICIEQAESKWCDLVKGESLSDLVYIKTKAYDLPKGIYYATLALSDAADNEILSCNGTVTLK
ncbi:hypothetical protein AAFF_G00383850 [Aldrovandia affinis]|uniref:Lymphocyte antigen 96 n=1 Tax=Aldrovandia affinis TaxID=143900 RepID=A0AAD7SHC5_9TELE|nr:hypothetical protein AAFF_G00383850 [Aldrovandia affinis]